jgi:hypothetical protein
MVLSSEYKRYLASSEWAAKRRECFTAWHWKCCVCDHDWKKVKGVCLQAHHLTYKNLGHEDIWIDLRPLCSTHHPKGHLSLEGIRLSRSAYVWRKRTKWLFRMLTKGMVWLWRRVLRRRPTAAWVAGRGDG